LTSTDGEAASSPPEDIADPLARARALHQAIEHHQAEVERLAPLRVEALLELTTSGGMTQTAAGAALGISKSRMSVLLRGTKARPERAFWAAKRSVVVAVGAKREPDKPAGRAGDMISFETLTAFEELSAAAREVGLDAELEAVPMPGVVDLTRPGLIVLTNPRLLPGLAQVMAADPALRYAHDAGGWYIRDLTTGTDYRSPQDAGEPADYGYVGRLPRPDGAGTFLYAAGTHAPGTWAAVRWLVTEYAGLYEQLRTRRWSAVVRCTLNDPYDRQLLSVERVTDVYRHEAG
jgi:hypothetical protein